MRSDKRRLEDRELTGEEQEKLDELYRDLGKAYYEGGFEDPLPQLLPLFDEITALTKRPVEEIRCPVCGAVVEEGVSFCEECGYRLDPEPEAVSDPEPPSPGVCQSCGNQLKPGARFCGKCGTQVG